jgi:hypothetical protein
MRYLKKYEQHKNVLKGLELYESITLNLNKNEKKSFNYILGITSDNYENLSESAFSKIVDRLKSVARKGVLTATLFSTLMSSPGFSQTFDQLTPQEKTEIQQMIKKGGDETKTAKYESDQDEITIDLTNLFKSGRYKLGDDVKSDLISKLGPIKEFIKKNDGDVIVTIVSSESRVPNRDAETGNKMAKGQLAQNRFDSAKTLLTSVLGNVKIVDDIKIGGPEYKGDDANQDKYSEHQFIRIKASVNKDVWSFRKVKKGMQATKESGYVGIDYKFNSKKGSGNIHLEPGSIPDRCKVFVDGKEVGDTGFFSDKDHAYSEFNYVPLYILSLTKMYNDNPNSEAIEGIKTIEVSSVQQLNDILLKDKSYDINKDKRTRSEINSSYQELIAMVSKGDVVKIAIYEKSGNPINLTLTDENKAVNVKVYSPVQNTEYIVFAKAGSVN